MLSISSTFWPALPLKFVLQPNLFLFVYQMILPLGLCLCTFLCQGPSTHTHTHTFPVLLRFPDEAQSPQNFLQTAVVVDFVSSETMQRANDGVLRLTGGAGDPGRPSSTRKPVEEGEGTGWVSTRAGTGHGSQGPQTSGGPELARQEGRRPSPPAGRQA